MASMTRHLLACQPRWCLRRALHLSARYQAKDDGDVPVKSTKLTQPVPGGYHDPIEVFRKELSGKGVHIDVPAQADVLIMGGGAVGLSAAYWLQKRTMGGLGVTVVERDPTYSKASTPLSVGGIRQQFSVPENIKMSQFGAEFIRDVKEYLTVKDLDPPEIPFTPAGYLLLAGNEQSCQIMKENHQVQRENGAQVKLLSPEELKDRFPWLNTNGVSLGSYGMRDEGWFDPWSLLLALKVKAASLGVKFVKGEVVDFTCKEDRGIGFDGRISSRHILDYAHVRTDDDEVYPIKLAMCINAAGAWASEVGRMAGIGIKNDVDALLNIPIPVEPRKRYVFVVHCPDGPLLDMPLIADATGMWVRREGLAGQYICGISPQEDAEEPDNSNLEVDHTWFDNKVWPKLANRIPAFECLKQNDGSMNDPDPELFYQFLQPRLAHLIPAFKEAQVTSSYAGYYDYNYVDQNLIIGNHPYHRNFFMAVGSSGHGIQHAPAIGRALSELVLNDEYETIDLSRFCFDRIFTNDLVFERNII